VTLQRDDTFVTVPLGDTGWSSQQNSKGLQNIKRQFSACHLMEESSQYNVGGLALALSLGAKGNTSVYRFGTDNDWQCSDSAWLAA
jgi:hypothetical protein